MHLNLQIQMPGKSGAVAVSLDCSDNVLVGEVADLVADRLKLPGLAGSCLAVTGRRHRPLARAERMAEAGIRSGDLIELQREDPELARRVASDALQSAAAVLVVRGKDKGFGQRRYPLRLGANIVGRDPSATVVLDDAGVSRRHASINVRDVIEVDDLGSANGVWVAGQRVQRPTRVEPNVTWSIGDTVVHIERSSVLPDMEASLDHVPFNPPPRIAARFEGKEYTLPAPPEKRRRQPFPFSALLLPLLLLAVLVLAGENLGLMMLAFLVLSPLLVVGTMVENHYFERKEYEESVADHQTDVDEILERLTRKQRLEVERRRAEVPTTAECDVIARTRSGRLWERRRDAEDLLELGVGIGTLPSRCKLSVEPGGNRRAARRLRTLPQQYLTVGPVPAAVRFSEAGNIGVAGGEGAADLARALVVQAVTLHSPADLSVAAIIGPGSLGTWEWLKWLPHARQRGFPVDVHPLAATPEAAVSLIEALDAHIEGHDPDRAVPGGKRVLVLVDDTDLPIERSRLMQLLSAGPSAGVHVLWVSQTFDRLPSACGASVLVGADGRATLGESATGAVYADLEVDRSTIAEATATAVALSPVVDVSRASAVDVDPPDRVTLPVVLDDMAILDQPQRVLTRWSDSQVEGHGLPVVIGDQGRGPMVVDIRRDGPHALIAGTTGAGKSELLQSLLASLAVTHSPERLTFLLVDYKGGAAFKDCKDLPHTVGFVTDLDHHEVHRSLVSLNAELTRRERILNEHGAKDLMEMEERGIAGAPPSLMIVIDEFAALAKEVPEFVDGVVNVAQRGRSLGLHLLLATQRPAGVITDNIRANTNLRIALRVSDAEDSTDVIGVPTAAHLSRSLPGRAIVKVGPSELVPFQSSYVGATTVADELSSRLDLQAFHFSGAAPLVIERSDGGDQAYLTMMAPVASNTLPPEALVATPEVEAAPAVVSDLEAVREAPSDLERIVETTNEAFELLGAVEPRKPWLDPLPTLVDLLDPDSFEGDGLAPDAARLVIGRIDDPQAQAQFDAVLDLGKEGSILVFGASRSGKSALLRTIAVAAGRNASGERVHVYGMDFTGRGLGAIERLPHVGSVISGDDDERVARLVRHLLDQQRERSRLFNEAGGAADLEEYRRARPDDPMPRIIVLIDGYPAFIQQYESAVEDLPEQLIRLIADGRSVGIHLVLTSDLRSGVPMKVYGSVSTRIVLRMATDDEYTNLSLPMQALPSDAAPGRGYLNDEEIQVALVGTGLTGEEQGEAIATVAAELQGRIEEAPSIARLDTEIPLSGIDPSTSPRRAILGVSGSSLEPLTISLSDQHALVVGPGKSGKTTTLLTVAKGFPAGSWATRVLLSPRENELSQATGLFDRSATSTLASAELATSLAQAWQQFADGEDGAEDPGPTLLVIDDMLEMSNEMDLEEALVQLIALSRDHPIRVLAATTPDSMRRIGYDPIRDLVTAKHGVLLQPEPGDDDLLGAQFRIRPGSLPPTGRGFFIVRGAPEAVQVALPNA